MTSPEDKKKTENVRAYISNMKARGAERAENGPLYFNKLPELFEAKVHGVTIDIQPSINSLQVSLKGRQNPSPVTIWHWNRITGTRKQVQ